LTREAKKASSSCHGPKAHQANDWDLLLSNPNSRRLLEEEVTVTTKLEEGFNVQVRKIVFR
jgi:hypothetical protein